MTCPYCSSDMGLPILERGYFCRRCRSTVGVISEPAGGKMEEA